MASIHLDVHTIAFISRRRGQVHIIYWLLVYVLILSQALFRSPSQQRAQDSPQVANICPGTFQGWKTLEQKKTLETSSV